MPADNAVSEWKLTAVNGLDRKPIVLKFTNDEFSAAPTVPTTISRRWTFNQNTTIWSPAHPVQTPIQNVLWAGINSAGLLSVSILAKQAEHPKAHVLLTVTAWTVEGQLRKDTEDWIAKLLEVAYRGVAPRRRMKVLVNPFGGKGHAAKIYEKQVAPILASAQCTMDVEFTKHRFHATEIAKSLPLDKYDAIMTLSGDGLPHEVINGLATREDAVKALSIPIVPIPTGSANGFSLNLHGTANGFDVGIATLNAIKGKPMPIDICSITQGEKRSWSFFSQAAGLMADLDLGTEHLRWMGDFRFIIGYLKGIIQVRPCPIDLYIRSPISDKTELLKLLDAEKASEAISDDAGASASLPEDRFAKESVEEEEWVKFDSPILYIYGGMQPYVGKDLLQFPLAKPSDGLLDLVVQEVTGRGTLLGAMDGAELGSQFWLDSQHYFKTPAFRLLPTASTSKGLLSIDGESYPWAPLHVEVHKSLAKTLTLNTELRFIHNFDRSRGKGMTSK